LLADLPALLLEPLLALLEPPFEAVFAEGISVLHHGVDRPHGPPVEREDALRASVTRRGACTASTRHVELKSRPFEARRDPDGSAPRWCRRARLEQPSRECRSMMT
jgi:hypothetical protein